MAKVTTSAVIKGLSGKLGDDCVFRQMKDGRIIICKKPDFSNRQFSEAQLQVQSRTKEAAAYAKVASRENPIYAEKAKRTSKTAYNIAFADWHKPPVIHSIRCSDGHLQVFVQDNVMVTKVTITILGPDGTILEQEEAKSRTGTWWEYQSVNAGKIRVEAWDLPGNRAVYEFSPPSGYESFWEQSASKRRSG